MRQSVAAIIALASAARLRGDLPDEARDALELIGSEASRIAALAAAVFEGATTVRPVHLDEVALGVAERVRLSFPGRIDVTCEPAMVVGDEVGWWRVVANLVDNACRAAGADGEVAIAVRLAAEGAVLEVADSGPGFGRGVSGSNGIGLDVVLRTVDRCGGRVSLGRSPLGGAHVRIELPTPSAAESVRPA